MTMEKKIADMNNRLETIYCAGGERKISKQHSSGKKTARERLNMLFDEASFQEIDAYVKHHCTNFGMNSIDIPGEGVVTGYGKIAGRGTFAYSQDFTAQGGTLGEMHAKKICKVMDMALDMKVPIVGICDSGGARIQEGVFSLSGYGQIFFRNTKASGIIPQISAIMGPCAGGAVYSPALTDFIFMTKAAYMFITGPQVIKATTGEDIDPGDLGGPATHNHTSGVAHFMSDSDEQCLEQIRQLLSYLPSNNAERPICIPCSEPSNHIDESLQNVLPSSPIKTYNMLDIIKRVVDEDSFFEVQKYYAPNIIIGYARLNGRTVGIVANQPKILAGCLDINASDKASKFIRFCDAFNIPLITFVDVPGFLPGVSQEYGGIIRHGAKMLYAYSEAVVPKITLILRKAYGGAYQAMCSRDLGADHVIAWPTAEVAVMGAEGAANIIFKELIEKADNSQEMRKKKIEEYKEKFSNPYMAAAEGFVDRVIDPKYTRIQIIQALEMCITKECRPPSRKHGIFPT
jgi:methylmalonyl-CoA decarboxylase subunit alpha